ncbi:MAG: hypothetical protein ABWX59_02945 [Microbacteriaceae bacterium]
MIILVANGISVCAGLFGGWVSDRIGRKRVLATAIIVQIIAVASFFPAAATADMFLIILTVAGAISGVQSRDVAAQGPACPRHAPSRCVRFYPRGVRALRARLARRLA